MLITSSFMLNCSTEAEQVGCTGGGNGETEWRACLYPCAHTHVLGVEGWGVWVGSCTRLHILLHV